MSSTCSRGRASRTASSRRGTAGPRVGDVEHAGWPPAHRGAAGDLHRRLRDEDAFVVERGSPADGLAGLLPLFGGIRAIVAGVVAFTTSRRSASRLRG